MSIASEVLSGLDMLRTLREVERLGGKGVSPDDVCENLRGYTGQGVNEARKLGLMTQRYTSRPKGTHRSLWPEVWTLSRKGRELLAELGTPAERNQEQSQV